MKKITCMALVLGLLIAAAGVAIAAPNYSITSLGDFTPKGLNESGEVVGTGHGDNITDIIGVKWTPSAGLTVLPKLKGQTSANGINDLGKCVGWSYIADGDLRAVTWDKDTNINVLAKSKAMDAIGINNSNDILCQLASSGLGARILLATGRIVELLPQEPWKETWGTAINENGDVVGTFGDSSGVQRTPAVWSKKGKITVLETLDCPHNVIHDINDAGVSVGACYNSLSKFRAVMWSQDGKLTELGWNGHACGINNAGVIVGTQSSGSNGYTAVIWINGVSRDISSLVNGMSGWKTLTTALFINNKGQIVGVGKLADGNDSAFLLTPGS